MSEPITSKQNEQIVQLRKLQDRKHRERSGTFAAEGEDMLSEALRAGRPPQRLYYDADRVDPASLPDGVGAVPVAGEVLASASALGSGSRVIGVWDERWSGLGAGATDSDGELPVGVYLHEVADPGNVGAVLRSALAFGPSLVVLSPGTADPFGPKAVRAGMGAVFAQPFARATLQEARSALPGPAIALVPGAGRPLRALEPSAGTILCLGSERSGLPAELVAACDEVARIPIREGGAESLNVAMTATVALYECSLHRLSGQ
jgi:RNA methyltransferase, TrmH family